MAQAADAALQEIMGRNAAIPNRDVTDVRYLIIVPSIRDTRLLFSIVHSIGHSLEHTI